MGKGAATETEERIAVPAMPMPMAIICCVLNFLIPGLGTILAGFTSMCFAQEDMGLGHRCFLCCISFCIGILQLFFVIFFLLGWIWSCIWGLSFIGMSAKYYHDSTPSVTIHQVTPSIIIHQPSQDQGTHYTEKLVYLGTAQQQGGCPQQQQGGCPPQQAWDDQELPPPYTIQ